MYITKTKVVIITMCFNYESCWSTHDKYPVYSEQNYPDRDVDNDLDR